MLAPALASTADKRDPRDSETDRGTEEDNGVARRQWLLWRGQRCIGARLINAHLAVPSILAITAARGGGDGHGGARPRLGRLRRGYGAAALNGDPTSFSSAHSS